MKRIILLLAVLAFSFMGYAQTEAVKCGTFSIECDGGGGTNYSSCGTYDTLTQEIAEVRGIVC